MHKQNGLTLTGLTFTIFILGFCLLLIIKLLPIYVDNYSIKTTLASIQSQPSVTMDRDEFIANARTFIQKNFNVSNIKVISADDIKITPEPTGALLEANYEARTNLFSNIDVVISFHDEIKVMYSGEK